MVFKGEYKEGKRYFGKIKNFTSNYLKFEGKYINGKLRSGKEYYPNGSIKIEFNNKKGRIYNENGNLIYEGGYFHRQKYGKGKEYDNFGNLLFEGEYLNGERKIGKEYNEFGNIVYEGEY